MRIFCLVLALVGLPAAAMAQQPVTIEISTTDNAHHGPAHRQDRNEMLLARVNVVKNQAGRRVSSSSTEWAAVYPRQEDETVHEVLDFDGRDDRRAFSIACSSPRDMEMASTSFTSIPTTAALGSFTRCIWKTRH
jgi:hypothetical protein